MSKPDSPCRDCPRHASYCHNKDTCPSWGRYQDALTAYNDRHRAHLKAENFMTDYDTARRKRRDRRQ